MEPINHQIRRKIFTISELTLNIKSILEENFSFVWIAGEISNFKIPSSGHYYFTLKDEYAQINAVMFRGQNRNLKFEPEDGLSVIGLGRISVYEPRGVYQIILEYLEPKGAGALQVAFEQLKKRLLKEGLFDEKHKTPLPFLPKKISIITSATGAVVFDIIKIINRRFQNVHIEIIPVKVQGEAAEKEIVSGLELLNEKADTDHRSDVAIIARGGGSMEDLFAFNSEDVARAIFSLKIPVISAIGHETDFTIADFVADLRAPTPSAAAEMVVPQKEDLKKKCQDLKRSLTTSFIRYIDYLRVRAKNISDRLKGPTKKIEDLRLKTDDYLFRLIQVFENIIKQRRQHLSLLASMLNSNNPVNRIGYLKEKLEQVNDSLLNCFKIILIYKHSNLKELTARLNTLSPLAILSRGYSITRTIPDDVVVTDPKDVSIDQKLKVILARGFLTCRVERKKDNDKTGF